jgi:hypothetical protein
MHIYMGFTITLFALAYMKMQVFFSWGQFCIDTIGNLLYVS